MSPSRVRESFDQTSSHRFGTTATITASVSGDVYVVIVDRQGVIDPNNVQIQQVGDDTYQAAFQTSPALTSAEYKGALAIKLCAEEDCSHRYGSADLSYDVKVLPAPTLTQVSPDSVVGGGPAFTITANGSNFTSDSVLNWNSSPRTTTRVSSSQRSAQVLASDIASSGSDSVSVADVSGGVIQIPTRSLEFTVSAPPPPTLISIGPQSATGDGPAFTTTVSSANFTTASMVLWNGGPVQPSSSRQHNSPRPSASRISPAAAATR